MPSLGPLLVLLAMGLGLLLRVTQYLANRSLWLDEAFLALTLSTGSYGSFLHQPLQFMQTAPPAFLWFEKWVAQTFGPSEWVLRALPLAAGLAAVPLYYRLAKRLLTPGAAAVAVALFALSSNLIYYSSEVKPYGIDVTVAILLVLLLQEAPGARLTPGRLAGYGAAGAVALWSSYPSGVVLIAFIVWMGAACQRRGEMGRLARLAPVWAAWAASFLVLYAVCLKGIAQDQALRAFYHQFWVDRFPSAGSAWGGLAEWLRIVVHSFQDPGALHLPAVAAALFVIGLARMARRDAFQALLVILPIGVTLGLTACGLLPFGNRLILFLVPFLLLPVGAGAARLWAAPSQPVRALGIAATALLIGPSLFVAANLLRRPIRIEELKPVLAHVSRHREASDAVYLYHWSQYPFRYYAARYGFDEQACILGKPLTGPEAWQQVDGLRQRRRAWVIVSQGYQWVAKEDEPRLVARLDQMGRRIDEVRAVGAAAYLYQFD